MKKEATRYEGMGLDGVRYTTEKTVVEFVLRPELETASIMKVWGTKSGRYEEGTMKDVKAIVEQFKKEHPEIKSIFNQVGRQRELIAMYESGLRVGTWNVSKYDLATHLGLLNKHGSICMKWYAKKELA